MTATPQRKDDAAAPKKGKSRKAQVERELDEALEESFPGSDPVSISQPKPSKYDKD